MTLSTLRNVKTVASLLQENNTKKLPKRRQTENATEKCAGIVGIASTVIPPKASTSIMRRLHADLDEEEMQVGEKAGIASVFCEH